MQKTKKVVDLSKEILRVAAEYDMEEDFFFQTTFARYQQQLRLLEKLQAVLAGEDDILVTKEYVKGRENVYIHPAVGEYNKTATAANQTVSTLVRIIAALHPREYSLNTAGQDLIDFAFSRRDTVSVPKK